MLFLDVRDKKYKEANDRLAVRVDTNSLSNGKLPRKTPPKIKMAINDLIDVIYTKEKLDVIAYDVKKKYNDYIYCTSTKPYEERRVEYHYYPRLCDNPIIYNPVELGERPPIPVKPNPNQFINVEYDLLLEYKTNYTYLIRMNNRIIHDYLKEIDTIRFAIAQRSNDNPDILYDKYINSSKDDWMDYLEKCNLRDDEGIFRSIKQPNENPLTKEFSSYYRGWRKDFDLYLSNKDKTPQYVNPIYKGIAPPNSSDEKWLMHYFSGVLAHKEYHYSKD